MNHLALLYQNQNISIKLLSPDRISVVNVVNLLFTPIYETVYTSGIAKYQDPL
jgi:hypothetical protein